MSHAALLVCLRMASEAFPPETRTHGDGSIVAVDRAHVHCTPVRARKPLALVTLDIDDGLLVALVSGTTPVWQDGHVTDDSLRNVVESAQVADLDGDGVDEVLIVNRHDGHERSGDTTLSVLEPPAGADEAGVVASLTIGWRNGTMPVDDGGSQCEATWKLVRGPHRTRRIVTLGGCRGTVPDDFALGEHVYALRGGTLVDVHAR